MLSNNELCIVRRFEHPDGWVVEIHLSEDVCDSYVAGFAALHRQGAFKCRIVSSGAFHDPWMAANELQTRAIEWIEDWTARDHSGITGFADL